MRMVQDNYILLTITTHQLAAECMTYEIRPSRFPVDLCCPLHQNGYYIHLKTNLFRRTYYDSPTGQTSTLLEPGTSRFYKSC